ncbi:NADH:flavin oxidoreductase/NADH oxidase [Cupriavidus sp. 30B13]|uniref:NADH:flavin oxidoreductase/NADH oxidase n=1 Tax=Cupriavidus sp. 30B13 TaxID=3384241 RepID=UPI003B91A869
MSSLFSPLTIRDLTLPNRIVVSPMCQYIAEDGLANDWHLMHLLQLAISGAGALTIESTAVEPDGRITPGDLGLWDDATARAFAPVLAAIRRHSPTPVILQLAHAGRKASSHVPWKGGQLVPPAEGGWATHAPSALPQKPGETAPLALDKAGIWRLREAFAAAARRAVALGVDALELHGGHGYLMHQFLSPIANQRTDEYGGSLQNRMRFVLEVFDVVRAAIPTGMPLGIKLSATDWVEGGWDIGQTVELSGELRRRGVDWIVLSSGGISPLQKISPAPGYQVPFSEAVRQATGAVTTAVGLITEPRQAEEIVAGGKADLVAIARAMLYDPRWPWHAAAELGGQVSAPPPYWRAPPAEHKDLFGQTVFGAR